jgi:hypothetical protein
MEKKYPIEYTPNIPQLRLLAEKFFDEELAKITDIARRHEVSQERETWIGCFMAGYKEGRAAMWVKANEPGIEEGEYVAKFKPINKKRDSVGVAFVDEKYVRFLCPPYHDIIWGRNHEELQYLQVLDESGQ